MQGSLSMAARAPFESGSVTSLFTKLKSHHRDQRAEAGLEGREVGSIRAS